MSAGAEGAARTFKHSKYEHHRAAEAGLHHVPLLILRLCSAAGLWSNVTLNVVVQPTQLLLTLFKANLFQVVMKVFR